MIRCLLLLVIAMVVSCKAKTPYNPYLKSKEKPSELITEERKKMEKSAIKKSRKQLRKNRKAVLFK